MIAVFKDLDKDDRITKPEWQEQFLAEYARGVMTDVSYFVSYAGWFNPKKSTVELAAKRFKALADMQAEKIAYADETHPFFDGEIVAPFLKRQFLLCGQTAAAKFVDDHAKELFKSYFNKRCQREFSMITQCYKCAGGKLFFFFRSEVSMDDIWGQFESKTKIKVQYYKPSDFGFFYSLTLQMDREEADTATLI